MEKERKMLNLFTNVLSLRRFTYVIYHLVY